MNTTTRRIGFGSREIWVEEQPLKFWLRRLAQEMRRQKVGAHLLRAATYWELLSRGYPGELLLDQFLRSDEDVCAIINCANLTIASSSRGDLFSLDIVEKACGKDVRKECADAGEAVRRVAELVVGLLVQDRPARHPPSMPETD